MRRVLLDENLPRLLNRELTGFTVITVAEAGWAGVSNGELLRRAAEEYDVLITGDRSLSLQQNPAALSKIGLVVLATGSTKLEDLRSVAAELRQAVAVVQPGQIVHVPAL